MNSAALVGNDNYSGNDFWWMDSDNTHIKQS